MTHRRPAPSPLVIALGGLALVVAGALLAGAIGHALVRQAYSGDSLPILNRMIGGRAVHGVAYYLAALDDLLRSCAYAAGTVVLAFATLSSERVRRAIDALLGKKPGLSADSADAARVPRRRVVALVALVVLVQGTADATRAELWPFSPYTMYSDLALNPHPFLWLAAITDSGEVRLDPARHVPPFGQSRLRTVLETLVADGDTIALQRALGSLGLLYERARREHRHALGPLKGVRLYRVEWTLDPKLRNLESPDRKTLLAEHVTRR